MQCSRIGKVLGKSLADIFITSKRYLLMCPCEWLMSRNAQFYFRGCSEGIAGYGSQQGVGVDMIGGKLLHVAAPGIGQGTHNSSLNGR